MSKSKINIKDNVVIITGAGRGLGRTYALELAKYGANVVVNDLGTDVDGHGSDQGVAQSVVNEIHAIGSKAMANTGDITDPKQAQKIIDQTIEEFGKIDAIINNAGIVGYKSFAESTLEDFEHFWKIHVGGTINVTKAAWPKFQNQGYGRVVLTASGAGLYGLHSNSTYSCAKGAIHGLMRTLALEGRENGIVVNSICPGGFTRMHDASIMSEKDLEQTRSAMPLEVVAPAIVWLVSDSCHVSGEEFAVWSGRVARIAIGTGPGYYSRQLVADDLMTHYDEISNVMPLYEPKDVLDEVSAWLEGRITGSPPDISK